MSRKSSLKTGSALFALVCAAGLFAASVARASDTDDGSEALASASQAAAPAVDPGAMPADTPPSPAAIQPEREWTFLVFMNGHNSLEPFTLINLHDMERVGSTDRVNVVVQWASQKNPTTERLFVQKQADPKAKTLASKVVQKLPTVDMGDVKNLVAFLKWGTENYPAKHYFVEVWNHGGGWHLKPALLSFASSFRRSHASDLDISEDDISGHIITTEQLGQAMGQMAQMIGHKVDLYGSDACLMSMVEVAGEMSGSVETSVGSEDSEPGAGWPYDALLAGWNALPDATSQAVAKVLAHAYVQAYSGNASPAPAPAGNPSIVPPSPAVNPSGTPDDTTAPLSDDPDQGRIGGRSGESPASAAMSVLDLTKMDVLQSSIQALATALSTQNKESLDKVVSAMLKSQNFMSADYVNDFVDLGDFANQLSQVPEFASMPELAATKAAFQSFVVYNEANSGYHGADGVTIWGPPDSVLLKKYSDRYTGLAFDKATGWSKFLAAIAPSLPAPKPFAPFPPDNSL